MAARVSISNMISAAQPSLGRRIWLGFCGLFVAAMLLAAGAITIQEFYKQPPAFDDSVADRNSQELEDYFYPSEPIVKRLLLAPSSADFSNPLAGEGGVKDAGGYKVAWGHVDAQNGFGVKVRDAWYVAYRENNPVPVYVELGDQHIGTEPESLRSLSGWR